MTGPGRGTAMRATMCGASGAALVLAGSAVLRRAVKLRAQQAMDRLADGEIAPSLAQYAEGATLRLGDGEHRWAGEFRGRQQIGSFLRMFADAGLRGDFTDVWTAGPPWAMRVALRFAERAHDPHGEVIYRNELAMMLVTRWGRIVEHTDLAFSTARIEALEQRLGPPSAPAAPSATATTTTTRSRKYRVLRAVLGTGTRTLRWALENDRGPDALALLETVGRRSGERRATPVANGLDGDTFWLIAAHGRQADFVRNLIAEPRVRVKVGRTWRAGTAVLLEGDDIDARSRSLPYQWDAALGRALATSPLTIRVDLDR